MAKLKTLLITYAFPPYAFPEAFLIPKALGNMEQVDVEVDVLTIDGSSDFPKDHSMVNYANSAFHSIHRVKPSKIAEGLPRKLRFMLRFPDFYAFTTPIMVNEAERMGIENYDVIMSSSQWLSAHLIGLELKKRYPKIKWIARFSDPWTHNPYNRLPFPLNQINASMEAKVFEKANRILFTSQETLEFVSNFVRSNIHQKFSYIPHCYDPKLYPSPEQYETKTQDNEYRICYTGHFYGIRSPEPLYQAVANLLNESPSLFNGVKIEIYGSLGKFSNIPALYKEAERFIQIFRPLPYLESLKKMQEADCLLVVDGALEKSIFLPSKLVDYLGAERFIFAITPPGSTAQLLKNTGGLIADPSHPSEVQEALKWILTECPNRLQNIPTDYDCRKVREDYSELFHSL